MSVFALPHLAPPDATRRVLVVAPHCDDETLGAGGLIAEASCAGARVTVAFLTNGDGFRVAATRALGEVHLQPDDFVRFAELRQREALRAVAELGVPEAHAVFLGFPDRGLKPLWERHWSSRAPYRSAYTGRLRSPYRRGFTPGTLYTGASLVSDLTRLLKIVRPTEIYVTHPGDDHPDHAVAPAFVQAALEEIRREGLAWSRETRIHYYIVHRGDWPLPQGRHLDRALLPPPGMSRTDTQWQVLDLPAEARAAKVRALKHYASQTALCGRFLESFLRGNEIFGTLAEAAVDADGAPVSMLDPAGDDLVRFTNPAADITRVALRRQGDTLRISLSLRGSTSPSVRYSLQLRALPDLPAAPARFLTIPLSAGSSDRTRILETRVPLASLGIDERTGARVWIGGETRWLSPAAIDRMGYRPFSLRAAESPGTETGEGYSGANAHQREGHLATAFGSR